MATFKAYDIRDTYPDKVNEELFEKIGNALVIFNNPKKVIVGMDMRKSSISLKEALIKGATKAGIDIIDIGLATTPMAYQSTHDFNVDLGIMITASHNPKEYNGMKMFRKNAVPISWDTGIKDLKEAVDKNPDNNRDEKGTVEKVDIYMEKYRGYLQSFIKEKTNLKIVIDAGNGMGGFDAPAILKDYADIIELYTELDGDFPNHEANPLKEETTEDLKKKVLETKADFGITYDGDADRMGVVDEKGNYISPDIIMAFMTHHFILSHPDETDYSYDLRSSKIVEETIKNNNKTPHKTRVGHSYIKQEMRENNSFFSGELSGHFYFRFTDDLIYDSAIRMTIELINAVSTYKKPLSELLKKYQVYIKSAETNFKVEDKDAKIGEIKSRFGDAKIEEIDGISIIYDNWWCNIRASNTENVLRLNLEADDQKTFDEKFGMVKSLIEN